MFIRVTCVGLALLSACSEPGGGASGTSTNPTDTSVTETTTTTSGGDVTAESDATSPADVVSESCTSAGDRRCVGAQAQICASGSWTTIETCLEPEVCDDGACAEVASCGAAASTRCSGNVAQVCTEGGAWIEVDDCDDDDRVCVAGRCEQPSSDHYYAVLVTDAGLFEDHRGGSNPCATSSTGMHGADIDAVELDDDSEFVGYFASVEYQSGPACTMGQGKDDPDQARGAPNGTLVENAVSLGGGWLMGEFAGDVEIMPGYTIVVYEIGDEFCPTGACVGDEAYRVYLVEHLGCRSGGSNCAPEIDLGEVGGGEAAFTVPAF